MVASHLPAIALAQWQAQTSNTTASLRGLCAVSEKVAWASGTQGTYIRTVDGGQTWQAGQVPGAEKLDFRDVEAFDANTAYLLSIGNGDSSRIYKTTDGGLHWTLQFKNSEPKAFFDALAFWDARHGLAMSDPVNGRFVIITTDDGGVTWKQQPPAGMPPALPNEGGFAAGGTCLLTQGKSNVWLGTGGATVARVFHSTDRGRTWTVAETPLLAGVASAGVFGLAFRDDKNGVAVGGDYQKPPQADRNYAVTNDGGRAWKLIETNKPGGFRSGAMFVRGKRGWQMFVVGPSGADVADGDGAFTKLDGENYNAVSFAKGNVKAGWAVGPRGRIAKWVGR
ncbi:MAG: glycosyl hydrolase [Acidobacteria bacterium]|nr:glycosyl hydrolase [Acidobacteriota bacterium]MBI3422218.1 glycosyl hydrolase [Acidobacteriota bacterium]